MTTAGFLYPGRAAEDDYPRLARLLGGGVRLVVEHTDGEDLHTVDALLDLGAAHRLAEGWRRLSAHAPRSVVWACTSGSFVFGWDGAAEQVRGLAQVSGRPASSTSFAFVRAARALGARRVAVAASYPSDVADCFVAFLAAGGLDVVGLASAGITTAEEVGRLAPDAVLDLVVSHDDPRADVLLVPDTAMRTVGLLPELERTVGKPVLTANQVTVWEGVRLAGGALTCAAAGALFGPAAAGERR